MKTIDLIYKYIEKFEIDAYVYPYYDGNTADASIMVVGTYGLPEKVSDRFFHLLDLAESENSNFSYNYYDEIFIDYDDNMAYKRDTYYGSPNYLWGEGEIIGKNRIDNMDEDEILEFVFDLDLVNEPTKAVPEWFPTIKGFEVQSCEYANDWYGNNDDPKEIYEKAYEEGYDVIFKIDSSNMFGVNFCILTRERN